MADERPYARLVASYVNCPLVELQRAADVDLRGALHGLRLDSMPGMRVRDIERLELDAARDAGATCITRGWGGDELFCRHHCFFHASDLLRDRWLSFELLDQIAYAAMLEGETLWTMLARVFRDAFIPSRWNLTKVLREEQVGQSLLNSGVERAAESTAEFDAPWAADTGHCGPGKLWQISLVTARRPYYSVWARDGDAHTISPLLSQPVVETCLRIPTYFQTRHRGERAVARAAFAPVLPPEVIARRSKGVADELAWKTFRANLPFIRELLLDGALVSRGIVDRARLERALADESTSPIRSTVPVFDLVGAEAWVQPWNRSHPAPQSHANQTRANARR
jgi:asparagine synthase (glutamine-hydrolysing)